MTVFGFFNRSRIGTDQLNTKALQNTALIKIECAIQRRLPAHGGQQRIWPFFLNDFFNNFPSDGLDVGDICRLGIGHDGGRVAIDQYGSVALSFERFAGLCA